VHRNACVLAGIVAGLVAGGAGFLGAGCTGAAPSGFPQGDHWTFPLVGALEGGVLLTPVTVRGKGPYLFAIDPDSSLSAIDQQVVDEAGLRMLPGPSRLDEAATEQGRGYAELLELKVGTLAIDQRQVMLVPASFYNTEGRRVNGVLGRDVIGSALVFGFDRDQGLVTLSTPRTFTPPPDAIAVKYTLGPVDTASSATGAGGAPAMETTDHDAGSRVGVATRGGDGPRLDAATVPRRIAIAQIGDAQLKMHLDLGEPVSQLREALWPRAKLTRSEVKLRMVDEVATVRMITGAAIAPAVTLGAARSSHVTFAPYADKRFAAAKVDGALGLDFFLPYAVYASWDATTFYLKPRAAPAATATARLGRWGAELPVCPHPGCIATTLASTDAGIKLDIVRDPQAAKRPLEIYLGVTPAAGKTAPSLVVELPAGADSITGAVPAEYDGATLTVLDVSSFTRPCSGEGGCVFAAPGAQ
jgi:aspartyl protease